MMKSILRMSAVSLLAVVIGSLPCQAPAQSAKKSGAEAKGSTESAAETKQPKLPYKGTLTAVDRAAKTMTIGKRTFQITPETKCERGVYQPQLPEDCGREVPGLQRLLRRQGWEGRRQEVGKVCQGAEVVLPAAGCDPFTAATNWSCSCSPYPRCLAWSAE